MDIIQSKELEIFFEIQNIMKKYKLRYFAIGGTCLGAVRHKGFIPWDDDIDIAMPREDYELFRTIYYRELPTKYLKLDSDNSDSNSFLFTKIYDSTTTYIEKYVKDFPDRYTGVFVDIMPVDGLPNDIQKKRYILRRIQKLSWLNCLNRPWPYVKKSITGFTKFFLKKILQAIYERNYFSMAIMNLMKQFDYDNSDFVLFTWRYGLNENRMVFPKEYFNHLIEVPFENGYINIPCGYDKYLRQDFGDYMKLPPVEARHPIHDIYICDMDTPYSIYVEQEKKKR